MTLAIVAFPRLDERDRQWIESFRAMHEPQASRIALHFTLVFPCDTDPDEIGGEVEAAARSTSPISFAIRRAVAIPDAFGARSNVFLVPDEGGAEITTLHERLYAGALGRHLRTDIPFVPHITIGATGDAAAAEALAQDLDVASRAVTGTITTLDVVDVGSHLVRSVTTYTLRKP